MADTGRVTQSFLVAGAFEIGTAFVTQSFIIVAVGLGITCANPPNGTVGQLYSHAFPAGAGDPPYTFAITVGSLPPGLALDAATGIVSGVPSSSGTYPFTIQVTDSMSATSSVNCSITIALIGGFKTPIGSAAKRICELKPRMKLNRDWAAYQKDVERLRPANVPEVGEW